MIRTLTATAAAVLAAGLGLAACGGESSSSDKASVDVGTNYPDFTYTVSDPSLLTSAIATSYYFAPVIRDKTGAEVALKHVAELRQELLSDFDLSGVRVSADAADLIADLLGVCCFGLCLVKCGLSNLHELGILAHLGLELLVLFI